MRRINEGSWIAVFCQDEEDGVEAEAEAGAETEVTEAPWELVEGGDAQISGETTIKHRAVNKWIHWQIWKHLWQLKAVKWAHNFSF